MRIIPAIDIIDGKCVRLSQGDYNKKRIYNDSPLEVAKSFEEAGIKFLHLVDLDGAKSNSIQNTTVLEEICSKTNLIVDFGGGVKSELDVKKAFNAGAEQVTLGSLAVKNKELTSELLKRYGEKIILGADVKGDRIAISGWKEETALSITQFIQSYQTFGLTSVISTDIATDGMLIGPSLGLYKQLLQTFPDLNVIASGGVSSLNDLTALEAIGVEGVIIGKAIYEGKITLKELADYVD